MRSIRRSRSAAGLFAAALLIAASGCGSEDTGQRLSPAPTESPEATDTADEPDSTWAPTVADAPEQAQLVTSTPVDVSAPFDAVLEESEYVPVQWLVPWDDGFLAVGVRYPAQPLPDQLPPEVAELFPPEVIALFPDGLPPTQQEAMDILREAGLLDVVMDILNEYPDAMDAVQSAPRLGPELLATWSIDGDSWMPMELSPPADTGAVSHIAVSGDRLTMAGAIQPVEVGDPWIMTVGSTTDLATWETASFALPSTGGRTELEQVWANPIAAATDDEHWVVRVMVDVPDDAMADPESDLPEWGPQTELWSGRWGGEPAKSDAGQFSWMLLATNDGFLDLGQGVAFSADGQTWTEVPDVAPNMDVQAAAPLGDDVLAITGTPYGDSSIVVLDATGVTIGVVQIPELGDGLSVWSAMSSPAFIVMAQTFVPYEETTDEAALPDLWLLATDDGETWLLNDLDEGDPDAFNPPLVVATNGTIVLAGTPGWEPGTDVWQRFELNE